MIPRASAQTYATLQVFSMKVSMTDSSLPRHEFSLEPIYRLFVYARPTSKGKGKLSTT